MSLIAGGPLDYGELLLWGCRTDFVGASLGLEAAEGLQAEILPYRRTFWLMTGVARHIAELIPTGFIHSSPLFFYLFFLTQEMPATKSKFRCDLCNRKFMRSEYLHRHIQHRAGAKPYSCGASVTSSSRASMLLRCTFHPPRAISLTSMARDTPQRYGQTHGPDDDFWLLLIGRGRDACEQRAASKQCAKSPVTGVRTGASPTNFRIGVHRTVSGHE
ncbi:hypothetical protein NM208_g9055 [Fusarium decemcellulare]|uniref:Uncharacterized protein n=1 Tax=Fusarium decemcellulare TaxID=57161 RepID=A0ACC1S379_9HYPO|nr:hypothetical protein NM208_g9055 [Fusarium decemcellulare]